MGLFKDKEVRDEVSLLKREVRVNDELADYRAKLFSSHLEHMKKQIQEIQEFLDVERTVIPEKTVLVKKEKPILFQDIKGVGCYTPYTNIKPKKKAKGK